MKVAILGCGPAGMLAAHAANGADVTIYATEAKPSLIYGAQYVHEAIPGLTDEKTWEEVSFAKVGNSGGYANKVYGSYDAPCSWELFDGSVRAYPMLEVYQEAWRRYSPQIKERRIVSSDIAVLCDEYDLVFSSIPADRLCQNGRHQFSKTWIWSAQAGYVGVRNLIVYSGRPGDDWYRASNLFGFPQIEFPGTVVPKKIGDQDFIWFENRRVPVYPGIKPTVTNCDCHLNLPSFERIGRFGRWKKGILVTNAYHDALNAIADRVFDDGESKVQHHAV